VNRSRSARPLARPLARLLAAGVSVAGLVALGPAGVPATASGSTVSTGSPANTGALGPFKHLVVIYQENHSFDNLYGGWGRVHGERVHGRAQARLERTLQVKQGGLTYACLLQDDPNLTSPDPLSTRCRDSANGAPVQSHFVNAPFAIDDYIKPTDTTCPPPGGFSAVKNGTGTPGGCTRDLVHRFYQEQYQLHGGKQDRYTTGSDAVGLTQGYYRTRRLPIYRYLHSAGAPRYVVADKFFQAAFGGSFLNHQYLVAAQAPVFRDAVSDGSVDDLHQVLDTNALPTAYPLYTPTVQGVHDGVLTQACGRPTTQPGVACGDRAVNTVQPFYQPYSPGTPEALRLPPLQDRQSAQTIGDRLSDAHVSWAWYAGGWDNAAGNIDGRGWTNGDTPGTCTDPATNPAAVWPNCPDLLFQYHHQPFVYFDRYAPGTRARARHLRDEKDFLAAVRAGHLRKVSFVKPVGEENEHPGYTGEHGGSDHVVALLKAIARSPQADDTLVVVTYDESGGQWDHVPPPGQGTTTAGPHDAYGPGTRVPALLVSARFPHSGVDSAPHDTLSIMASIERSYGLAPLHARDAAVSDLGSALRAAGLH